MAGLAALDIMAAIRATWKRMEEEGRGTRVEGGEGEGGQQAEVQDEGQEEEGGGRGRGGRGRWGQGGRRRRRQRELEEEEEEEGEERGEGWRAGGDSVGEGASGRRRQRKGESEGKSGRGKESESESENEEEGDGYFSQRRTGWRRSWQVPLIRRWRDIYSIAVRWRQVSEPIDAVVWIDQLTAKEFEEGFGSVTGMTIGQMKNVRYSYNTPRALEIMKGRMDVEREAWDAYNRPIEFTEEMRAKVSGSLYCAGDSVRCLL